MTLLGLGEKILFRFCGLKRLNPDFELFVLERLKLVYRTKATFRAHDVAKLASHVEILGAFVQFLFYGVQQFKACEVLAVPINDFNQSQTTFF